MRRIILGKLPDQLKLPFYLWTRQAVADLIHRECGARLSLTTVGRYLEDWGMTAQKPVRRAYERNDAAIAAWLAEQYPLIAKQAHFPGIGKRVLIQERLPCCAEWGYRRSPRALVRLGSIGCVRQPAHTVIVTHQNAICARALMA